MIAWVAHESTCGLAHEILALDQYCPLHIENRTTCNDKQRGMLPLRVLRLWNQQIFDLLQSQKFRSCLELSLNQLPLKIWDYYKNTYKIISFIFRRAPHTCMGVHYAIKTHRRWSSSKSDDKVSMEVSAFNLIWATGCNSTFLDWTQILFCVWEHLEASASLENWVAQASLLA